MLVRLGKRARLHCDDCRHSVMIEPAELAQQHRLDMLTTAPHALKGDALHAMRSAEGMLLAGAAQHMALKKKTPGGLGVSPGVGSASHLGGHRRWLGTGDVPRIRAYPDSLEPERAVDKPVDSLWMIGPPVLTPGANGSSGGLPGPTTPCRAGRADTSRAPAITSWGGGRLFKRQRPRL